ncbi:hypothetical protein B566_EDAN009974 [Ephemera danica]|nr:hypothetical protein B566_EDAN009974 [Ephemera danica]
MGDGGERSRHQCSTLARRSPDLSLFLLCVVAAWCFRAPQCSFCRCVYTMATTTPAAIQMAMLFLAAASAHGGNYHYASPAAYSPYAAYHAPQVLTVLAERPLAASAVSAPVPLIVMPQDQIHVVHGDVSAPSRIKPYVQVKVHDHLEQAMPAVKVQLRHPILISSLQSTIPFPTRFTVLHNGYSQPLHVGSVIAPLPPNVHVTPNHPATVNYVYAVPTGPYHFPAYYHQPQYHAPPNYVYYSPVSSVAKPIVPAAPAKPIERPEVQAVEAEQELAAPKPQDPQVQNRPEAPIVTVLDFPNSVAQPPALFYQPPATGLGNREPPQAVAPAGIVQSTAPIPNLSVFVNSKESPYLQILRDEAQRQRISQGSHDDQEPAVFVN